MRHFIRTSLSLIALCGIALFYLHPLAAQSPRTGFGRPHITAVKGPVKIIARAQVKNFGKTIYRGRIDINPTLKRIRAGRRLRHRNDGAYFQNRERRLPRKTDRKYYREFVHKMKGFPFPGPQRVIIGKSGEVYYTPDHYRSFTRVNK